MSTPPGDQPPYGEPPEQPYQQPGQPGGGYQQPGGGYQQPGQPPYPGYGYGYGQQYGYPVAAPDHPKATTAMVLGIVGLVACQIVSPFAWSVGKRTVAEIDASGGRLGGRGQAQAGYILGIVGTIFLGLGLLFMLVYFVIVIIAIGASST